MGYGQDLYDWLNADRKAGVAHNLEQKDGFLDVVFRISFRQTSVDELLRKMRN